MEKTVRETIKEIIRKHLKKNNGQVFGQYSALRNLSHQRRMRFVFVYSSVSSTL